MNFCSKLLSHAYIPLEHTPFTFYSTNRSLRVNCLNFQTISNYSDFKWSIIEAQPQRGTKTSRLQVVSLHSQYSVVSLHPLCSIASNPKVLWLKLLWKFYIFPYYIPLSTNLRNPVRYYYPISLMNRTGLNREGASQSWWRLSSLPFTLLLMCTAFVWNPLCLHTSPSPHVSYSNPLSLLS